MADYFVIEPENLRKSAEQHRLIAADLRKWGAIPQDWLDEFPATHGTIADPMYGALVDFYNDRHEKAERLARNHERTRDQLLRSAEEIEQRDDHGRQQISQAGGGGFDITPGGTHAPGAPNSSPPAPVAVPVPPSPISPVAPGQPAPAVPAAPVQSTPDAPLPSAPGIAQSPAVAQTPSATPSGSPASPGTPITAGAPIGSIAPVASSMPAGPAVRAGTVPGAAIPATSATAQPNATAPATTSRPVSGPNAPSPSPNQRVFTPGSSVGGPPPGPLPAGPLAASAHAAGDKRSSRSLVVGDTVNADLVLAHTLLAAVIAAVGDSAPDLNWATAVAVTSRGPVLLLTSNEGRGWMPTGLFLPSEVVVPWRLESRFRPSHRQAVSKLVGIDDPALMLAELVSIAADPTRIRLSALASSTAFSDRLRTILPVDVLTADHVSAAPTDVDLSKPGAGLVDRLHAAGTIQSRRHAETVSDIEIEAACRKLVHDALALIDPTRSGTLVGNAFIERRADELQDLLGSAEPDRQIWRDMLYTYDQMIVHLGTAAPVYGESSYIEMGVR